MRDNTFKCPFPNCNARYQRREHLRRHQAQHNQQQLFLCSICDRHFGRSDTLRRHIQKLHGVEEHAPPKKQACAYCRDHKSKCQGGPPCSECLRRGIHCSLSQHQQVEAQPVGTSSSSPDALSGRKRHFLDWYFKKFHHHWPFIHQASFHKDNETPLLLQSMVAIGLWVSEEPNAKSKAVDLHNVLSSAIHEQKEVWDASTSEFACSSCAWPIPMYQAILLHIIFAALHKSSGVVGLDLKPSLTPADAEILRRLVASCKKLGMLYYPNMLDRYCQDDIPSYIWVGIEEVKRFNITLFKVCRAFSSSSSSEQQGSTESVNTAEQASRGLCASDLQFPLPRNTPLWNAVSKEEWESAGTEDVYRLSLNDTLEGEWISKSAEVLELNEA